jgi:tRNA pseudouridine32 synthase / 23S rRNA pseudouridine746 synthase
MLQMLLLDDTLLALNKPAGLPVQPDGWDPAAPYLLQEAQAEYGRLWIVHRLDKSTTGVILLARTAEAHRSLSMEFERHQARKIYHAIVNGLPAWQDKSARQSLWPNVGHRHRTIVDRRRGKASVTEFSVHERFQAHALLEAQPLTGRTHQVRAHAAAVGHPILGDALYGAPPTHLISRVALHALKLEFHHPTTGRLATLEAPYPDDFEQALRALRESRGS